MNWKLLRLKIRLCLKLLFSKNRSWVVLSCRTTEMINLLYGKSTKLEANYFHTSEYLSVKMMKYASNLYDDIDMVLLKAKDDAKFELYKKKHNESTSQ